jgi:Ca2+-binding RTX toxin-like protein
VAHCSGTGAILTAPTLVGTSAAGNQIDPHVIGLGGGTFAVSWMNAADSTFKTEFFTDNVAPTDLNLVGTSVLENADDGATIGELLATDTNGSVLTYEIQRSDGTWDTTDGRFVIDGAQLKVASGLLLDYEQNKTHTITIRVVDEHNASSQETFTINIGDVTPENVVGSDGSDIIYAGAGSDILSGGGGDDILSGGAGTDRMTGGLGNDIYYVHDRSDVTVETTNGGMDLVYSSVSLTLAANVEHLVATGLGALTLTGNNLNNGILGNNAKNTVKGGSGNDTVNGGGGNDTLYGGTGKDIFSFNTPLSSTRNKDFIKDWSSKDDTIHLENQVFKALKKTGALSKSYFKIGSKAADSNDYIGYNKTTGDLWYDANGSKSGGQVVFANLGKNKTIAYNDLVVI